MGFLDFKFSFCWFTILQKNKSFFLLLLLLLVLLIFILMWLFSLRILTLEDSHLLLHHGQLSSKFLNLYLVLVILFLYSSSLFCYFQRILCLLLHLIILLQHHVLVAHFQRFQFLLKLHNCNLQNCILSFQILYHAVLFLQIHPLKVLIIGLHWGQFFLKRLILLAQFLNLHNVLILLSHEFLNDLFCFLLIVIRWHEILTFGGILLSLLH